MKRAFSREDNSRIGMRLNNWGQEVKELEVAFAWLQSRHHKNNDWFACAIGDIKQ